MGDTSFRSLLIPPLVAAALFLPSIGNRPLYLPDEARYALLARNMVEAGHWLVPHIGSEVHMEKPPLFIWLIAVVSLLAGGVTELAATLPAALSGIAAVALTCLFGCRLFRRRVGLLAGLILATTPNYFLYARMALADMTVTLFVVFSAWMFWETVIRPGAPSRPIALFWIGLALAFSAKGPVGLMPVLAFGAFLWLETGWRGLSRLRPLTGAGILAVISAPWALAFALQGEASYVQTVLIEDYLVPHVLPWRTLWELFYILGPLGIGFLPWSLFLPTAAHRGYSRNADTELRRKFRFLICWVATYAILITLMPNKRDRYLLPVYPALALMVGWLWDQWWPRTRDTRIRLLGWLWGVLAVGGAVALLLPLHVRVERAVLLPSTLAQALPLLGILLAGGVLGVAACQTGRGAIGFSVIGLSVALGLAWETTIFVPQYDRAFDVRGFSRRIASRVGPEEPLVVFQAGNLAYDFYLRRSTRLIRDPKDMSELLSRHQRVYVVAQDRAWRNLPGAAAGIWTVIDQAKVGGVTVFLATNAAAP